MPDFFLKQKNAERFRSVPYNVGASGVLFAYAYSAKAHLHRCSSFSIKKQKLFFDGFGSAKRCLWAALAATSRKKAKRLFAKEEMGMERPQAFPFRKAVVSEISSDVVRNRSEKKERL